MLIEKLDPVMEERLLKKYRDHAKKVETLSSYGREGFHTRGAADQIFSACIDLAAHEREKVPGEGPLGSKGWTCAPDCLTCYEQARDVFTGIPA